MGTKKRKNKVNINVSYLKLILGAVGFIILVGSAFWVTDKASIALEKYFLPFWINLFLLGFVLTLFIIIIGSSLGYSLNWRIISLVRHNTKKLENVTHDLEDVLYKEEMGFIPSMENYIAMQKSIKNLDKITLSGKYSELQKNFIQFAELSNYPNLNLYISGTMLGTYNDSNSISLAKQLCQLAKLQETKKPFSHAQFCTLGHRTKKSKASESEDEEVKPNNRALYPFSARLTAGEILLEFFDQWFDVDSDSLNSSENLEIGIKFLERQDIFPAIQLWGNQAAMIICSTGATDRYNNSGEEKITAISEAMPVALVMKNKNYKLNGQDDICYLGDSLKRLVNHLENDYKLKPGNRSHEIWKLSFEGKGKERKISILNYRSLQEQLEFLALAKDFKIDEKGITFLDESFKKLETSDTNPLGIEEFRTIITALKSTIEKIANNI